MKFLTTAATALALSVTATAGFAACDDGEIVIKFAHVTNTDKHPKGIAASLLESRVNEEMNGKACMEVYPNSTLYNDDQVLEAMLQGDVQLAAPSLSKFETFTKQFRLFDLPFMFKNIDAVDAFQNSDTGQAMLDSMQKRGLQGLAYWHNGMKQMSANKPLLLPEDANGLKFRVQSSDVLVAQMEAIGGSPQKMAFSEVYGALQQGVVDGQENTWSNIYTKKFYEVQDSVTETNHQLLAYLFMTSSEFLNSLEPEVRDQFIQIADEVTQQANLSVKAKEASNRENILKAGGEINVLSPQQREQWIQAMKPVWKQFEDYIGKDLIDSAVRA